QAFKVSSDDISIMYSTGTVTFAEITKHLANQKLFGGNKGPKAGDARAARPLPSGRNRRQETLPLPRVEELNQHRKCGRAFSSGLIRSRSHPASSNDAR
ncbi:MAG: hypothetical protein ACI835_001069, partial [Planctomycetota bacterium]